MASLLKDYYGEWEVVHLGGYRDKGIDLKLVLNNEEPFLVQIKRRKILLKNEGVKVVRELNGVLFHDNNTKGIIITTAKDYTRDVYAESNIKTHTKETYQMNLLKFNDIIKMLGVAIKQSFFPWNNKYKEIKLRNNNLH